MNEYQHKLYQDLLKLCDESEAFYYVDQDLDETHYRIFSYRLASYTEFLKPNALECRGHMFEIDQNGMPLRLVALPFAKFFNLGEHNVSRKEEVYLQMKYLYETGSLSLTNFEKLSRDLEEKFL